MARIVFRMLVTAGIGALGGLMMWLEGESLSAWMVDPLGFSSSSLGACLLGGAAIGALLALVLDALGLDLPLFPERRERSATSDLLSAPLTKDQLARLVSASQPSAPPSAAESIRATIRDWSSGSAEGWIDRDTADRIQGRLRRTQVRAQMLFFACVLVLTGLGFTLFDAVMSGGAPTSGIVLLIYTIAIACCAAVFWMGGAAWRVMAAALGIAIAYVAYYFRI
jgi:hypothetical protein